MLRRCSSAPSSISPLTTTAPWTSPPTTIGTTSVTPGGHGGSPPATSSATKRSATVPWAPVDPGRGTRISTRAPTSSAAIAATPANPSRARSASAIRLKEASENEEEDSGGSIGG